MPQCKTCEQKGIFLSLNKYGLCDMCYSGIWEDYRNRERILIESRRIIKTSKNPETQLRRIDVMKEHFQVLLNYERMGIPITNPLPSAMLKRLDAERDQIIKNKNRGINKEPLERKYKRLSEELSKQLQNIEIEEMQSYNRELGEILNVMVDRNNKGIALEKSGNVEEAIKLYEQNVADEFRGTHPYDRLTIIYRKRKQFDDEIRILKRKILIFEKINQERLNNFLRHCPKNYPVELIENAKSFKQIRDARGNVIFNPYPIDDYKKRLEKAQILKKNTKG